MPPLPFTAAAFVAAPSINAAAFVSAPSINA
jgi:hypothetical protein